MTDREIITRISDEVREFRKLELVDLRAANARLRWRVKQRRAELGLPETDDVHPMLSEFYQAEVATDAHR